MRTGRIGSGLAAATLLLGGCAQLPFFDRAAPASAVAPAGPAPPPRGETPGAGAGPPAADAATEEDFDTTSAADRVAAAAPPPRSDPAAEALGTTIASLGDPADPGFWAETPLVRAVRPGRLTDPASGASVQVELRPTGGAPGSGTRVSLPALRVLGVPLTALPELQVTGL